MDNLNFAVIKFFRIFRNKNNEIIVYLSQSIQNWQRAKICQPWHRANWERRRKLVIFISVVCLSELQNWREVVTNIWPFSANLQKELMLSEEMLKVTLQPKKPSKQLHFFNEESLQKHSRGAGGPGGPGGPGEGCKWVQGESRYPPPRQGCFVINDLNGFFGI